MMIKNYYYRGRWDAGESDVVVGMNDLAALTGIIFINAQIYSLDYFVHLWQTQFSMSAISSLFRIQIYG